MKRIFKVMSVFLLALFFGLFTKVNAETYNVNDKVDLGQYNIYFRQGNAYIRYYGVGQFNYMYFYRDFNNVEHKAYCLNLGLTGAEGGDYVVDASTLVSDPKVASILISGSPYKSLAELGLNNEEEATMATQFAVWVYLDNLNLDAITPYQAGNENVVNAIRQIYTNGMNMAYTTEAVLKKKKNGVVDIDNINDSYYSIKYNISHNDNVKNIDLSTLGINGVMITDLNNNPISNINNVSEFKILIPRTSITKNEELILNFVAQSKQTSVMFGATSDPSRQNIGLLLDPVNIKNIQDKLTVNYKTYNINIRKIDKDNSSRIAGVTFRFQDMNGNNLGDFTTNSNGEINVDVQKDLGIITEKQIKVTEISAPSNYVLDTSNTRTISIKWNDSTSIDFKNEKKKAQIKVIKVDLDNNQVKLQGVKFNVLNSKNEIVETLTTNANGEATTGRLPIDETYRIQEVSTLQNYVLNSEVKTVTLTQNDIKNITFTNELKKGQIRIIKVDKYNNEVRLKDIEFKVLDEDNNLVDTLVTDENGEAITKRLRIDKKYKIQETKNLEDYDLNEEVKTVTLTQNQITDITFENELKKGKIKVIKVDLDDNEVKLKGIEFKVFDEDNNLVDTLVTDENGEAITKDLRVDKTYNIKETRTLENYVLNEEEVKVTLKPAEIKEITFENEKIKGQIKVIKLSIDDNKYTKLKAESPIKDVEFKVYDIKNNLIETIVTDENGIAITGDLLKGKYILKETKQGKYYLLNEKVFEFEIKNHREVLEQVVYNDSVDIDIEIEKTGFIETQNKDNIFYNFKNIHNKSNVPLDNFTWNDLLPTDAVRLDKIYTGTWNEKLEYSVWFRTNKNDFKVFIDKLDSETVYELDFNDLELKEDEYITEFEFRFGTVKVDFKEEESPIVFVNMLDKLKNGFTFTNYTKVSGDYLEEHIEDKDKWTTIIYNREVKLNKELPKTR